MQENNTVPTPEVTTPVVVEQPKQSNFLVILLSILLIISVAISGFFAYQTQKLVKELSLLKSEQKDVSIATNEPVATNSSEVDPTANWSVQKSEILGVEFRVPPKLGELEMSGKELNGEKGTQYCMIFVGSLSFTIVKPAYAGSGACGGGVFNLGTISKDYVAGREGGFGDMNGYIKEGATFSSRFTNEGKYPLPSYLVKEVKNKNGVTYLKIKGESKMSDYGGEQMKLTTLGTPGEGYEGALFNIVNDRYYGFGVSMEIKSEKDELIFDQILSTFKYLE